MLVESEGMQGTPARLVLSLDRFVVQRARRIAPSLLRRERLFAVGAALFAFGFAWVLSGPGFVPLINWDNGSYVASIALGTATWSSYPWNNHMGILQEYLLGTWLARALGMTLIDGFRIVGATAFTIAFVALADTLRVLTRSLLLAALLSLAWATAWVNLHYHLIIEDNWLFLAPAAVLLRICLLRADRWRWRDGLTTGALLTLAFLGSWQALPYLAPPMAAAFLAGPSERSWWARARDALFVPAASVLTLVGWAALTVLTSSVKWAPLSAVIFSRPEPSFLPKTAGQLWAIVASGLPLDTIGTSVQYHLTFSAYALSWTLPLSTKVLGCLALGIEAALFFGGTWWALRRKDFRFHLLPAMLLLFTLVTSLHKDEATYAELKRFDFVPLFLVLIAGVALGATALRTRGRTALATLLVAVIAFQTVLGLRWAARARASYRTTVPWAELRKPPTQVYGRDGLGWFGYFRRLKHENPQACRFVFVVSEFNSGRWNTDLMGALWSELPDHLTIGVEPLALDRPLSTWRYPARYLSLSEARRRGLLEGCAWLSEDARALVKRVYR